MSERQVRLVVTSREVSISAEPEGEVLRYTGICVVHVEDGRPVEQTWVPLGATPGFADDEALIATWRAALQWRQACA
ncbi:hypothetical protein [Amycolatopsis sp. NBC_01286]|uniref:hypothetical protein n=1 Tax=Amycolatopsis sp. NBC_01286 TaxID=2903560 RepID=UPI002E13529D|nr:hypothetical protein OG570_17050 [Amycolatopsis sp. NBC_01286]